MSKKKKSKQDLEALKDMAAREAFVADHPAPNSPNKEEDGTINARARDEKFLDMVERIREGQSIRGACGLSKFPRTTLYRWIEEDPEVKALIDEALDEGFGVMELRLMQATSQADDADWRAVSWMLARRFPTEYGEKKELEITAKKQDGIPEVIAMIEQTNGMMEEKNNEDDQ
jgi:hypothetical protein